MTPLTPCGICVTDTQLPDFGAVEQEMLAEEALAKKKSEVEAAAAVADHTRNVHGLKIETSSQFLSPPPEDSLSPLHGEEGYTHDAPCNVVQPTGSITSQTQSASFSCRSSQECDTFGSSSSDDSDHTMTIASSNYSSSAADSYALSSYASVLEDDTMDYGYGTLSGSSSSGSED